MHCRFYHSSESHLTSRLADLAIKPWDKGHCDTFYVVNARVIDPKEGKVMEGQKTIKIEKGKIVSVDDVTKIDANASQYDAEGRFVCPGLIDAHVHVTAVPGVAVSLSTVSYPVISDSRPCRISSDYQNK